VSVGSTPTCAVVDDLSGVDEIRPGNYAFFDLFQAAIGSCVIDDIALSILGTVLGTYPERGAFVIDTGGTALSHDPGPRHVDPACGYGIVLPLGARATGSSARVVALSQEHARVAIDGDRPRAFSIGDRVRVLPNHSCMAAGLFDRYHVVRGETVVDVWRPAKYWSADAGRAGSGA
jgi:D-serine deaminase-like pyridoxal phosphate-dependent protein